MKFKDNVINYYPNSRTFIPVSAYSHEHLTIKSSLWLDKAWQLHFSMQLFYSYKDTTLLHCAKQVSNFVKAPDCLVSHPLNINASWDARPCLPHSWPPSLRMSHFYFKVRENQFLNICVIFMHQTRDVAFCFIYRSVKMVMYEWI